MHVNICTECAFSCDTGCLLFPWLAAPLTDPTQRMWGQRNSSTPADQHHNWSSNYITNSNKTTIHYIIILTFRSLSQNKPQNFVYKKSDNDVDKIYTTQVCFYHLDLPYTTILWYNRNVKTTMSMHFPYKSRAGHLLITIKISDIRTRYLISQLSVKEYHKIWHQILNFLWVFTMHWQHTAITKLLSHMIN